MYICQQFYLSPLCWYLEVAKKRYFTCRNHKNALANNTFISKGQRDGKNVKKVKTYLAVFVASNLS